jgi:hypothetical protein
MVEPCGGAEVCDGAPGTGGSGSEVTGAFEAGGNPPVTGV